MQHEDSSYEHSNYRMIAFNYILADSNASASILSPIRYQTVITMAIIRKLYSERAEMRNGLLASNTF